MAGSVAAMGSVAAKGRGTAGRVIAEMAEAVVVVVVVVVVGGV